MLRAGALPVLLPDRCRQHDGYRGGNDGARAPVYRVGG